MVKLSIVIPYYKTYDLTVKLLDVLIPQITKDVEVILVDDGCNEERLDVYNDVIKIIHTETNRGGASAMNVGVDHAKGTYIAIIDSDDMIDMDYVGILLETIKARREDVIFFDWQDMNTGVIVRHPNNYAIWKAIYRRKILPRFRDGWRYSYDVPFQEDMEKIEHSKYYIDKVLYYYNSNREGNLTQEKEEMRKKGMKQMIKCEVIEKFTLGMDKYSQLNNIERADAEEVGVLFLGDKFETNEDVAKYLSGSNRFNRPFVKILEVRKEELKKEEEKVEKKPTILKPRKKKFTNNK